MNATQKLRCTICYIGHEIRIIIVHCIIRHDGLPNSNKCNTNGVLHGMWALERELNQRDL